MSVKKSHILIVIIACLSALQHFNSLYLSTSAHSQEISVQNPEYYLATVNSVIDGDTIWVTKNSAKSNRPQKIKLRLIGIDAYEIYPSDKSKKDLERQNLTEQKMKSAGIAAKNFLQEKLPAGTTVKVVKDKKPHDPYGRDLAYVYTYTNNEFINKSMIENGLAGLLVYAPNDNKAPELQEAYLLAKKNNVGLWAQGFEPVYRWNNNE